MVKPTLAKLRRLQEHAQAYLTERSVVAYGEEEDWFRATLLFCARVYHNFVRNRCPVRAAALAYTNLLALVPLLAVAISVSAGLLKSQGQQSIQDWIRHGILQVAPSLGLQQTDALETVVTQLGGFVANFQSGKLGVTAVLALIFLAISLLATIETTLNDMWGVQQGRRWFTRVVQYWSALTLGPLFLLSAFTLTTWVQVVQQLPLVGFFGRFLAPLAILSFGCALLYLVMPNTKVPWQAALLGGLVAGMLLQLNSVFNVFYVSRVLTYKQLYGSMAALPLLLLGLYVSWVLVLLGAQVAYVFQNRRAFVQEKLAESVSQRGREFLALRLMTQVGIRFAGGQRPPSAPELADELGVPLRLVGQVMTALFQSGLVLEAAGGEAAYAPGRPLAQISVRDILQALRGGANHELTYPEDAAQAVVDSEFKRIEEAWQQPATSRTLEELVQRIGPHASSVSEERE